MGRNVLPLSQPRTGNKGTCIHCGTPFHSPDPDESFCCRGCEYVHGLISERGWERYYSLRDGAIQPVKSTPFHPRDTSWVIQWQQQGERNCDDKGWARGTLSIQGISCVGCVWLIERLFHEWEGAGSLEIDAQRGRAHLSWKQGLFQAAEWIKQLQQFGYLAGLPGEDVPSEARRVAGRMGLCAAFALNTMLFTLPRYLGMEPDFALAGLFELLAMLFATLSLGVGGSYFATRAWSALRIGVLHMDFPIALGLVAAWLGSMAGWFGGYLDLLYFDFVAIFTFLMLLGRYAQEYALERNRDNLLGEDWDARTVGCVDKAGALAKIRWHKVRPGDRLEIEPGSLLPVCARCDSGSSQLSLEWINGESEPRSVSNGDMIPAGALNISRSPVSVTAVEAWPDSLLAKLVDRRTFNPRNPLLEKVLRAYIAIVLVVAVCGGAGWWLLGGQPWTALQVFISILVVSCPCALGVAIPRASEMAIAKLRGFGVFVREETLWHRLESVRTIAFDKTGTLTLESPRLLNPNVLEELQPEARQVLAWMIATSFHPVGRCLREALATLADRPKATSSELLEINETPGCGVSMNSPEGVWSLGRPGWNPHSNAPEETATAAGDDGRECEFRLDGRVLAYFRFAEEVRPNAARILEHFHQRGLRCFILSGDRAHKVKAMARQLKLPEAAALAELSPEAKADWVRCEKRNGGVLMIGDGANDSLAFDEATCRGTPVVDKGLLEHKADFYFLGRDLNGLLHLYAVRKRRAQALNQVFTFAVIYNLAAVGLCLAGLMNPLIAAIIMPLSSLVTLGMVVRKIRGQPE